MHTTLPRQGQDAPPADPPLREVDPEVWQAIKDEERRQHDKIELIASENYVSRAVLEAQGSVLTNKYAEGYPGRRYYGGCEYVDVAENLAIERAKQILRFAWRARWRGFRQRLRTRSRRSNACRGSLRRTCW